ncbi:MAG: dipicolinate synthase subunit B [Clostridia bacterium]|nr:dipicolinate synthase subunit B [Clostridia bacterium]
MIGYALCGSFCTHARSIAMLERLVKEYEIQPILSERCIHTDTRFGSAAALLSQVESLCRRPCISTVEAAEPLGPKMPLDALIIAPCTGNTMAKIAAGITDGAVTMAAKAHLRGGRPLLLAAATNDALSANLSNIGQLLLRKHVYFVPMAQDDPTGKPTSMIADFSLIPDALKLAMEEKQLQPLFLPAGSVRL